MCRAMEELREQTVNETIHAVSKALTMLKEKNIQQTKLRMRPICPKNK